MENWENDTHISGRAPSQDFETAFERLKKLAEHGNMNAQCKLGVYYFKEGDMMEGFIWLDKAAEQGHELASMILEGRSGKE